MLGAFISIPQYADHDIRSRRHPRRRSASASTRARGSAHRFRRRADGRDAGGGVDEHRAQHPAGAAVDRRDLCRRLAAAAARARLRHADRACNWSAGSRSAPLSPPRSASSCAAWRRNGGSGASPPTRSALSFRRTSPAPLEGWYSETGHWQWIFWQNVALTPVMMAARRRRNAAPADRPRVAAPDRLGRHRLCRDRLRP